MDGDQAVGVIWSVGALVLVASALAARRLAPGAIVRMVAIWVLIFAVLIGVLSYRDQIAPFASRMRAELIPASGVVSGDTFRVRKSLDGHFWVNADVDGVAVRFLIDSGATMTALSPEVAARAGIALEPSMIRVQTANGIVAVERGTIARLAVGPIVAERVGIVSAPAFDGVNVLGMNFLSSLRSWSVEGDWLVLRP